MEIIKEDVFRKQLKKGISGGFLFFGEEDYLKNFSVHAVREAICTEPTFEVFNDVRIDALDYSASALINALSPPPMMAEQKLVTVNSLAISEMKPSELEELYDALSILADYDYNVLIICVPDGLIDEGNLPKNPSPVLNELAKYLTPVRFEPISESRLVGWVEKHFAHNGVIASPNLCSMLISLSGRSMYTLSSECEKISYYVLSQGRNTLTAEDIRQAAVSVLDADTYALANAILEGKQQAAIHALNVMRFNRIEPVIILSELSKTLCDMFAIKLMLKDGTSNAEMTKIIKSRAEYRTKLYASAVASKSEEKLRRTVMLCSEADLSLKLSLQGYTAIERLICCL